jgi:hypothetical protein
LLAAKDADFLSNKPLRLERAITELIQQLGQTPCSPHWHISTVSPYIYKETQFMSHLPLLLYHGVLPFYRQVGSFSLEVFPLRSGLIGHRSICNRKGKVRLHE